MPDLDQVHGNADVVRMLEHYLREARKGKTNYLLLTAIEEDAFGKPEVSGGFAGAVNMEPVAKGALKILQDKIDESILNCTLPPRDPLLDASHVCYDMTTTALSFDFLAWLVDAEMTRVREGAPAPLKVAFWGGRDGKTGLNLAGRDRMLAGVCRPSLALIGAVEDERAMLGRHKRVYALRDVSAAVRAGEPVPIFKAPFTAVDYAMKFWNEKRYVTITLREADHWPHRNSNLQAWTKFARWLEKRGERVIFVRDTGKAMIPFPGHEDCPSASVDLHIRMSLYMGAKANLFVSNGPATLAQFSCRPWLMFIQMEKDGHPYFANTPKWWRENHGLAVGEQLPWSRPDQRIVYKRDDYANLVEAWEQLEQSINFGVGPATAAVHRYMIDHGLGMLALGSKAAP